MKRRFPGDMNGPPGGRHFDARGGRPPMQQGRGGAPFMGRGPPGRFLGRGGPVSRPPIHHPGGRGAPLPIMGSGRHGRSLPPPPLGRGPPMRDMGRPMNDRGGMRGPPNGFGGRGPPPPGRIPIGRGIPPPPPPRMGLGPAGGAFPSHPPLHRNPIIPPPPIQPDSFPHHPHPRPVIHPFPPPPVRYPQHPLPAALPPVNNFPPPVPFAQPAPVGEASKPPATTVASSYAPPVAPSVAQPRGALPAARTPVPTQQQLDAAWSEHTAPNGAKFFYNPFLNQSTYIKPAALKKSDGSDTEPVKKQWQEYTDPSSGKKYYCDGTNTTWENPAESSSSGVAEIDEQADEQPKKKKKTVQLEAYSNKDEAIAAFKGLLLAKGIPPSSKWNDVAKLLSSNPRWESFADILSVGERRQALAEYQTKRANDLKNQERQERIRAKEAFGQLLTDVLQNVNGFSAVSPRFSDVRAALAKDDRFHGVSDEATRESLFLEFCEELRKREQRKKRCKKREIQEAFNSFLREKEETGILTFASTWDLFLSKLAAEEKEDSRFKISPVLTENERQIYFADFVILLQAEEDDKRRRIHDARFRAEKAQREAYRDVLRSLSKEGRIRPYTRWRAIVEFLKAEEAFKTVLAQDQDAPMEIFEEFVDGWDDAYHRERALLSRLIDESWDVESLVKPDTSFEDFTKTLLERAERPSDLYSDIKRIINREEPVSTARVYWEELVSKAQHAVRRQGSQVDNEESSEDEGEIIEEEVSGEGTQPDQGSKASTDRDPDVSLASESVTD